ncbi:hypothetical protein [Alicyclobacillus acidocaldarius]|uniref:hypothetical protein n=1 Tax=Alicyclobacillus acidocaldarius TaxID=405212 RepID=UPI001C54E81A|nr:hypothetical protein [Alicyclobacillus acidocaldarius]
MSFAVPDNVAVEHPVKRNAVAVSNAATFDLDMCIPPNKTGNARQKTALHRLQSGCDHSSAERRKKSPDMIRRFRFQVKAANSRTAGVL